MTISVPQGSFYRLNCAIVLEDNPVGEDSRLGFETFPERIEEVYALTSYREIGADRMPQPGGVAYRGGNWSTFSLDLEFRAGSRNGRQPGQPPGNYTRTRFEYELQEMSRKARWCQALAFPLERELGELGNRIIRRFNGNRDPVVSSRVREAISELRRKDPPKILVVFGSWMTVRGYCSNVSLTWQGPFDPVTTRPTGCKVNIQIQPLMVDYPTWQSIRNGAWEQQAEGVQNDSLPSSAATIQEEERRRQQQRLENSLFPPAPGG